MAYCCKHPRRLFFRSIFVSGGGLTRAITLPCEMMNISFPVLTIFRYAGTSLLNSVRFTCILAPLLCQDSDFSTSEDSDSRGL
ncbi:MAG: hypothetical protein BWK80_59360 [Desulfobacteraceae bacterium IS3]|nr:MAG: hypothetical protein BWK80_59360 [Desulfobacteraceae bacterium IS3]